MRLGFTQATNTRLMPMLSVVPPVDKLFHVRAIREADFVSDLQSDRRLRDSIISSKLYDWVEANLAAASFEIARVLALE